jgi:hypothetical protein
MVKFADEKKQQEKFDPIQKHIVSSLAAPAQPAPPPTLPAEPEPTPTPEATTPVPELEPQKSSPERPKKAAASRSPLKRLTKKPEPSERLTRVVKCLFTPSEERELRLLVARLANEAGTSLTLSHLLRPYFDLLLHCEDQLAQELARAGISRPLNDKTALAFFERQLAEVIHSAMRKAPPLRTDRQDADS